MPKINGLSFPLRVGPRGSFLNSEGINKVKDNLKAIVLTHMGERLMSPNFGSVGYQMLFKNYNGASNIESELIAGIENSDKRIIIVSLDIIRPKEDGKLIINMTYKLDNYTEIQDLSVQLEQ